MINDAIWRVTRPDFGQENLLELHPVIAFLLEKRGLTEAEEIRNFLYPDLEKLYNPFLMKDMDKAVKRIHKAIERGEQITIYGDYDVDGITSTCILVKLITKLGGKVDYYIPTRMEEGYGLNLVAIEKIKARGTSLMITVDNGIGSFEEVKIARELGLDIIITDHHEPGLAVPDALAVINPKQKDCPYPFKNLAGVGVALKLAHALAGLSRQIIEDYLDLACLGTVADIVPLLDENRIITKIGLQKLHNTSNTGLIAMASRLNLSLRDIDTDRISFMLAPRINAVGRIADPSIACELLLTEDPALAMELAEELEQINRERQSIESKIFSEAKAMIEENIDLGEDRVIVLAAPHWHPGVLGIVASKLVNAYHKPCFLLVKEEEIARGSGRSVPGFNMFEALCQLSHRLVRFGGHDQAAGITIKSEDISGFTEAIKELASDLDEELIPELEIDLELEAQDIDLNLAEQLEAMEPFGFGNPKPIFMCRNLSPCRINAVGNFQRHLKMSLKVHENTKPISAIGFSLGSYKEEVELAPVLDVAFHLEVNRWQGYVEPQLNIKDLKAPYLIDDTLRHMEQEYYRKFFSNFDTPTKVTAMADLALSDNFDVTRCIIKQKRKLEKLLSSERRVLVVANTPYKVWRLIKQLKQNSISAGVFYHLCSEDCDLEKIIIIINPRQAHLGLADDIVFYDMPFSQELLWERLRKAASYANVHLFFNPEDLRFNELACQKALPTAEGIRMAYRLIMNLTSGKFEGRLGIYKLKKLLCRHLDVKLHTMGIVNIFNVFRELGIIDFDVVGDIVEIYNFSNPAEKLDLEDSNTYRNIKMLKRNVNRLKDTIDSSIENQR